MSFITAIIHSRRKGGAPGRRRWTSRYNILLIGPYFLISLLAAVLIWDAGVFYRSRHIQPHVPDNETDGARRDIFTSESVDRIIALLNERKNQYDKILSQFMPNPPALPTRPATTSAATATTTATTTPQ